MDLLDHFRMMAHYSRIANQRLYEKCAELEDAEYRRQRQGSFGSIHGLLNHILLGDRLWMSCFERGWHETPPLATVLFEAFPELRAARQEEDARIEAFCEGLGPEFFGRILRYRNNQGRDITEKATVAIAHLFNHQTHHRGHVHVMLSQTGVGAPSLDLHRIMNP